MITYDVEAKRTRLYRRILSRYLIHEQNSVFGGTITDATLLRMHRDLAKIASGDDRIFQVVSENRNNVSVTLLRKADGNANLERVVHDHHRIEAVVL
jgi:CRISPR-associated protein Cas2